MKPLRSLHTKVKRMLCLILSLSINLALPAEPAAVTTRDDATKGTVHPEKTKPAALYQFHHNDRQYYVRRLFHREQIGRFRMEPVHVVRIPWSALVGIPGQRCGHRHPIRHRGKPNLEIDLVSDRDQPNPGTDVADFGPIPEIRDNPPGASIPARGLPLRGCLGNDQAGRSSDLKTASQAGSTGL